MEGKFPGSESPDFFFSPPIHSYSLITIPPPSPLNFTTFLSIQKSGSSLLGVCLQSSMHPLQCMKRGRGEARKPKWQPIPSYVSSSVCHPRTVVRLHTLQSLQSWLFLQNRHQAACTCPPFLPWFSHHKASDLCSFYTAVLWKMVLKLPSWCVWKVCSPGICKGVIFNALPC